MFACRGDVAVRAEVIRADCDAHFSILKSFIEGIEDVWALILNRDYVLALFETSFDPLKVSPRPVFVLINKESSLDREGHLSVDIKTSHTARSISSIGILDTDSALALHGRRACA